VSLPVSSFCVCARCSAAIANGHRAGDERLGRDWRAGHGCGCSACSTLRAILDAVDHRLERVQVTAALFRPAQGMRTPQGFPRTSDN